jgi:tetratricopeptide (TPR) repeat protein
VESLLIRAFHTPSPDERLGLCLQVVAAAPLSPVGHLAAASASREVENLAGSRRALDRAIDLAPEWEAVHYEDGKFWLGCDEMERAREAFERAADRMPTFAAAFSNLGATLGELDRREAAVAAFTRAAEHDPGSFTILNNIGVVNRELGRLDQSEAALARVTELAPEFVFGHYNLGHTRLLRGDYAGALAAYEEGQRRDPERNRRQGCRLAIVRFANGDLAGANRDLWHFANLAPAEEREDLLLEAYEIARALAAADQRLAIHRQFLDRIADEISGENRGNG